MATDKKSQHVGNHGGRYTDMDGMSKQFTYIDHDRNTTRLTSWDYSKKKSEESGLQKLIDKICREQVNETPEFILAFDTEMAEKYKFERFKKGSIVLPIQLDKPQEGEEWFNDLKRYYGKIQKRANKK